MHHSPVAISISNVLEIPILYLNCLYCLTHFYFKVKSNIIIKRV